jgi:hypothetical protein
MSAYAHLYGQHDYNKHPFVPIGVEALVHDKPHKRRTYAEHCRKAFVLGTSTEHYQCWKFWSNNTWATRVSGAAFFKHKYITNPAVTPEDIVIAAAANLSKALATNMPHHLRQSSIQALADLQDVFSCATNKYDNNPTTHHIPEANIPTAPQRQQLDNNRLQSPSRTPSMPPRVQPSASLPRVPNDIVQSRRFSPRMHDVPSPSVTPTQLNFKRSVFPQPSPPENPLSSKKLRQLQCIANIGILNRKPKTLALDAPTHNTRSQTQVQTIMQEAIVACFVTYSDITNQHITACNASCRKFPMEMLNVVLNMTTGKLMEMRHLLVNPKHKDLWGKSYTKELERLAQGVSGVTDTDTIIFIQRDKVPLKQIKDKTYGRVCVNYCPKKEDLNRTRLTVGGNCINYPGNCGTSTVDMVTVKLHLNSVISTKGACYCTIDLKDFYLMTPMARPTYMHMKLKDLTAEFVELLNLTDKVDFNGYQ